MYVRRAQNIVYAGFGTIHGFRHPLGVLQHILTCTRMHTMEYYSAVIKKGILPFSTTWMDLEAVTLSEISQREKDNL